MLNICSWLSWPSVCLLWRETYLSPASIFCLGCLFSWYWAPWAICIFWRLNFCMLFICKYFLPFWQLSFHLILVSFAVQKLLSSTRDHLLIFVFIFFILGGRSKKISLWFMSKSVFPMFSFMSFIVNGLASRSLMHFEFIFVYDAM